MNAISRYLDEVEKVQRNPELREGQAHLIALSTLWSHVAKGVVPSRLDPFNDDRVLPEYLDWVEKVLADGPPTCPACGHDATPYPLFDDARGEGNRLLCTRCLRWTLALYGEPPVLVADRQWAAALHGKMEHADIGNGRTLCGIEGGFTTMRHLWRPEGSCPDCAARAEKLER